MPKTIVGIAFILGALILGFFAVDAGLSYKKYSNLVETRLARAKELIAQEKKAEAELQLSYNEGDTPFLRARKRNFQIFAPLSGILLISGVVLIVRGKKAKNRA